MDTPYTPKEYILNVLNQCLVSLQETDDFEIMKPEIIKAARLVQNITEKPSQKTDTTPHVETDKENVVKEQGLLKAKLRGLTHALNKLSDKGQITETAKTILRKEQNKICDDIENTKDRPDTPDIDSIAETNYENRRT